MSLSEGLLSLALILSAQPSASSPAQDENRQPPAAITCPASITVHDSVLPIEGWRSSPAETSHAFERISIANGTAGGQEYELAPDHQQERGGYVIQTWNVQDYRSMNVFLRCRYRDTPATLYLDLPQPVTTCTFHFKDLRGGGISGPRVECR